MLSNMRRIGLGLLAFGLISFGLRDASAAQFRATFDFSGKVIVETPGNSPVTLLNQGTAGFNGQVNVRTFSQPGTTAQNGWLAIAVDPLGNLNDGNNLKALVQWGNSFANVNNDKFVFAPNTLGSNLNFPVPVASLPNLVVVPFQQIASYTFGGRYTPNLAAQPGAFLSGPLSSANLGNFEYQFVTFVPEPAALALFGMGLACLGFARRRKVLQAA